MEKAMKMILGMAFLMLLAPAIARAEQGNVQLGFKFVREHCSRCHAILKTGKSPEKLAPPFRDLHLRYPIDDLVESLGEGIRTGHPMMPEFRLDPDQIVDLIAYLKTLER
jgi:mono/diheme cytochrome c family protein